MNTLTTEQFKEKMQSGEAFAVDFYADWCVACNEMMPLVESIANESPVPIYKVNIDESPELKELNRIKAIPMIMMYSEGRTREFVYGKAERDRIEQKLNRLR